jgi:hypothetical protein
MLVIQQLISIEIVEIKMDEILHNYKKFYFTIKTKLFCFSNT